nr:putative ribonuclease H-like domain-containing protein [Tanacetum cinerariifolium]
MAESSSHNNSSPEITPKEETVTFDKPKSLNPFLPATQVEFTFEEIAFTTNNEVALLYPSTLIKNTLRTCGVRGDIGYNGEIRVKGTHKNSCLPPRWRLLMCQIIKCLSGKIGGLDKLSNKDATILYCLANVDMDEITKNDSFDHIFARYNLSVLVDKTKSVGDGLKTAHTNSGTIEEFRVDNISKKIKPEDLSEFFKDKRFVLFTPDFPQDEPIIVTYESKEEDDDKEETHDTSHDIPKDTSIPPPPSLNQLKFKTELQALPVLLCSVQIQLKTLDSLPCLLQKVTKTLNRFATMVENASESITKDVHLAGQVTASPVEGEKNNKDAKTNLKDKLIDLLGTNVVTQYYNKKLLFDKYYDKMLKRKKSPKITKCEVLTKKGPITLKIYKEDGSKEVLSNLKHKPELRPTKDFEAKYNKIKSKLALLSSSALAYKASMVKSKGLITEPYEWNKEEVSSDDNEMVEIKYSCMQNYSWKLLRRGMEETKNQRRAPRNQDNRGREYGRTNVPVETPTENALIAQDRIGGQVNDKYKVGLGYKEQIPKTFVYSSEILEKQTNRSTKGYHVVPPPLTGNYMPPKHDLRLIDEHFKSESVDVSTVSSSADKNVKTVDITYKGVLNTEEPKYVIKNNFGPPIIKDWHSDDDSEDKLSSTVELLDESQVLLRVLKKDNIYSFDLKSVVPTGDLTYFFAKATLDESNLWHRRLGHIKFKTMNTLVKGNLVRDFLGYSFFATKGETSGILKTFITGIENQLDCKVKVIRSDNGTKFKNSVMTQICDDKGIKREYSVARTPQQNRVAKRRNRTLIEAARTMLVDSKLPTTFWAEAVNTACYVPNRVLVTKPCNKTPYELFHERPPLIDFMKPFGFPITILNIRDNLGMFEGKADEGYFVRNQTNGIAGTKENLLQVKMKRKKELEQEYILIPICTTGLLISHDAKDSEEDAGKKAPEVDACETLDNDDTGIFGNAYDDDDVSGEEVDMKNVDSSYALPEATKFLKDHPQEQATAKVTRVNDQEHIQALVDKQKVIIMEDNIRSNLCFDDAEGTACLPNEEIFEGLGRMIKEIDQDDEIALDADTHGRKTNDEMFGVDDLTKEEVVTTAADKDIAAPTTDVTKDEITIAQSLAVLKSVKPTIPAAATKEKGKAKMIEPEVPIKKKDQIRMDEEYARQLEAKEQEEARLSRAQQHEKAYISRDNT